MKNVVVIANPEKPEAKRLAALAEREFVARGAAVHCPDSLDAGLGGFKPDLAVVFGGDGTVLAAVAELCPAPPPILAFNAGRLGYLADNAPERLAETVADALEGRLARSKRMMVEARIVSGGMTWRKTALNEFVLAAHRNGRLLHMCVTVDDEELMDVRGDGMIFATPTGSTAYALSAGGPVVSPELSAIILAPICPHQLANRSMVLGPNETVRLRHFFDQDVDLAADGRFCLKVARETTLEVRASQTCVEFLSPARGRYKVLREKLGWGWKVGGW